MKSRIRAKFQKIDPLLPLMLTAFVVALSALTLVIIALGKSAEEFKMTYHDTIEDIAEKEFVEKDPSEGVVESLTATFCQDIYKENDAPATEKCALSITISNNVITVPATRDGNGFKYYDSTIRIGDTITYREDTYDRSGKRTYHPKTHPDTIDTINGEAVAHDTITKNTKLGGE